MKKQDKAIIETLQKFLNEFNCAFYTLSEPVKQLGKYFDLHTDGDGVIYVNIKTPEGDFSHGCILDVDIADLQSVINWLKKHSENVLRLQYGINV